jgi:selenoprotein W-related protein
VAEDVLAEYGQAVASLTLVPSSGGVFEVEADGDLVFSKKELGRHTTSGEVLSMLAERYGAGAQTS